MLDATSKEDQFSIEIIDEADRYLGFGIALLINLSNLVLLILGGRVSYAPPYPVDSIKIML